MKPERKNLSASVHDRLLNRSRERGEDFSFVLHRYAAERFLYRLGLSTHRERLVLKGAMLFAVWGGSAYRPTRDLDFTGYGNSDADAMLGCFREICDLAVTGDALVFDSSTLTSEQIRDDAEYEGLRVRLSAALGTARIPLQIDVGFGNAIEPRPTNVQYPTLLDDPAPRIRAYPHEAVIAEKFHCMVRFGERNSRLKDFYDMYVLAREFPFAGEQLTSAIAATFERRNTPVDAAQPAALAPRFYADGTRATQWRTYLERNRLPGAPVDFDTVGELIRQFLGPVWSGLAENVTFTSSWRPGGAWNSEDAENRILPATSTPPSAKSQEQQRSHDTDTLATAELELRTAIPLRRFKRYPAYKDSGVEWLGEIPADWVVRRLKYIASLNPEALPEDTDPQLDIVYVDIGSVDNLGRIIQKEPLTFSTAPSRARRTVKDGDVIVSTVRTYLRSIAPIKDPDPNMVVSTGFAVVRPNNDITTDYAAYALRAPYFVELVVANSKGVSFPAINESEMATYCLAVPPTTEQRAIATFLDRETAKIDALVARKERLIELLQKKRAALIARAVTTGLDPNVSMKDSGVEWLGKIPAHWELWRLKHVSGGLTVGIVVNPSHYVSASGVPFLRGVDVIEDHVLLDRVQYMSEDSNQVHHKSILRAGDLISIRVGYPGVTAVVPEELDGSNCASLLITRRSPRVDSQFLCYLMNSAVGKAQFNMLQDGAAQEQINVSDAVDFLVPLPPKNEQAFIVQRLSGSSTRIDGLIAKIRDGIDRLKELRTALISAAVTGKIDVRAGAV